MLQEEGNGAFVKSCPRTFFTKRAAEESGVVKTVPIFSYFLSMPILRDPEDRHDVRKTKGHIQGVERVGYGCIRRNAVTWGGELRPAFGRKWKREMGDLISLRPITLPFLCPHFGQVWVFPMRARDWTHMSYPDWYLAASPGTAVHINGSLHFSTGWAELCVLTLPSQLSSQNGSPRSPHVFEIMLPM
eukprot:gene27147-biopygen6925